MRALTIKKPTIITAPPKSDEPDATQLKAPPHSRDKSVPSTAAFHWQGDAKSS